MGWESPSHWVIIAVVLVVLFGYKKLPDMSRSLGRSLRIFKTEMKGLTQDDSNRDAAESVKPQADLPVIPPIPPIPSASVPPTVVTPQNQPVVPVQPVPLDQAVQAPVPVPTAGEQGASANGHTPPMAV